IGVKLVSKADLRIETNLTINEQNAHVGLLRDKEVNKKREAILIEIQDRLFTIGSILAIDPGNTKVKVPALLADDISVLEKEIDTMDAQLPPMRPFVLPSVHRS